ncbi:MAG TPA: CpXC domain-containing protein [Anaerolineales bacterium]
MPPKKTQISCPRCRQPVVAQIEQLFDVTSDPGAKQRLLGSVSNFAVCQSCGYNGPLATPIVYHDADKELLLTYFPGELGMPINEQEKLIGPFITQVTNRLPPEKRKAYLLRPQGFLTYQSLIERVLGADGITPEMIQAQQKRVSLVERLLSASSAEVRSEIIKQDAALFDAEFFTIFNRLVEGALSSGQEQAAHSMDEIQKQLLAETEYGRKVASQSNEIQEAIKTLQAAGKGLDREKLLSVLVDAPNDDRLNALVSFTRPGLDYLFFQSLTERIEKGSGEERKKLETLREKLLEITRKIDQHMEEETKRAGALLNNLLSAENIQQATTEHLNEINDIFVQVLNRTLQDANKKNDSVLMPKLQQIVAVLQQASAPPPELALLEEMLAAPDETALNKMIEQHAAEITPEFSSIVASVISRSEEQAGGKTSGEEAEMLKKLQAIYRAVLKFTMKKNLG